MRERNIHPMKTAIKMLLIMTMIVSTVFLTTTMAAENGPPLESLNISYWPEYDQPSVLVLYQGRLDSSVQLPATVRFKIPKNVRVAATSAVDSNGQFQYDRAWETHKVIPGESEDELTYETIHQDFQFEIYMNTVKSNEKRDFKFDYTSMSKVKSFGVEVQEPLRSKNFKLAPTAQQTKKQDGFETHLYSFPDIEVDQEFSFDVSYDKPDARPSKESGPGAAPADGGTSSAAILILVVALIIGGVIITVWRFKSTAPVKTGPKAASGPRKSGGKKKKSGNVSGKKNFCSECGSTIAKNSKFCRSCGAKI